MSTSVRELQMALLDMLEKSMNSAKNTRLTIPCLLERFWEQYAMVDLYHGMMIWI